MRRFTKQALKERLLVLERASRPRRPGTRTSLRPQPARISSHQLASPTTFAPQPISGECCFSWAHLFQAQKCVNMLQNAYELTSRHQGNEQTEGTEKTLTRNSNIMTEAELEAPHATTATSSFINMSICCLYWPLCRSCGLAFWG